jgi:dipeptidyl aminopeptidase B
MVILAECISQGQNIYPLDSHEGGYLDIVPSPEGYAHVALFSPANATTPSFLTSGEWEVVGGIKGVDTNSVVYAFHLLG